MIFLFSREFDNTLVEVAVHGGGQRVISQAGPTQGVEMLRMKSRIDLNQPASNITNEICTM